MSVAAYGYRALAATRSEGTFRALKGDLTALQRQLTTGKTASSHAGLGTGAAGSLSARATLASLAVYAENVSDAQLRLSLISPGIDHIARLAGAMSTSLPGTYNETAIGQTSAQVSAADGLKQVIDILNEQIDGRFLFGGRAVDRAPVAPFGLMLDGDGTRAGLRQLVAERKEADLGTDKLGRLSLGAVGSDITLAEEAAGLPFGLKILAASGSGGAVSAARAAGPPASATLTVAGQPAAGDTVTVELGLPDGSRTTLTLTARSAGGPETADSYAIGPDAASTAANLAAALEAAVRSTAATTLASASAVKAATGFFAGSPSSPPERVAGPPFATATATVAGTVADTVVWYQGDDGAGSARETAAIRTGSGTAVAIGARADEPAFRGVLVALGALAADTFPASDATARARYSASSDRVANILSNSELEKVAVDFAVASDSLAAAGDRLGTQRGQIEDTLADIENADPSEVASRLLATQTRLQASYQTTALVARLSLVEFV